MEDYPLTSPSADSYSGVLQQAQAHVLNYFNQRQDARLVYHNYQFATAHAEQVHALGSAENLDQGQLETALLAAWFGNVGYLSAYENFLDQSLREAESFLRSCQYPDNKIEQVLKCLNLLSGTVKPESVAQKVFFDAFQIVAFIEDYELRSPLLKLEWELVQNRQLSKLEWANIQLRQLLGVQLFTHTARKLFEPVLGQLIKNHKELVDKYTCSGARSWEDAGIPRKFQGIERKIPGSAIQTFFRSNYRNHINLSNIADGKANIMISVNSILISVLITVLTYRNVAETNPVILMPIVIFLLTGLASFIFAVLSARPKVTSLLHKNMSKDKIKKNIVFFGNFVNLDLDQYEEAMDAMFRDSELIYGNMTRDLYYLGKVLDKKYRFLTVSYTIFMIGFVAAVGTFLFALFTNQ